jgi:sugar/nucleoside kinase (ribokinase family)
MDLAVVKKYSIYGVGAALVDTEVEVTDGFLVEAGIDKGVMTLVDEARQAELLSMLETELTPLLRQCGGSVCNSVVAASHLGAAAFFSGKVADDSDGRLYFEDLKTSGVDFQSSIPELGTTGKCLVMVSADAERSMNTFLGVSEDLSEREIDYAALEDSEWLYLEGYLVTDDRRAKMAQALVERARSEGVRVAISLSDPFVADIFGDNLRAVIGVGVELIFCNKQEALAFNGGDDIHIAMDALRHVARTFVVTDGVNGSVCHDGKQAFDSPGHRVDAIDTNGAGDMFAGAFLYALTKGKNYQWAAGFANHCASRIVQQFGPRLSDADFGEIRRAYDL